jgi:tripartite-type tricarboxylate transporter receptor subunit TctC
MAATNRKTKVLIGTFLIISSLVGMFYHPAAAASAADFYKDKKITFIVSQKAGGGTDLLVRIIAPYIKNYTGAYAVVVESVPEAGGLLAFNRLWNSKPDGLTICTSIASDTVIMEAGKQEGVQFQGDKMNIIFGLTTERGSALVVNAKGHLYSVDDLKKAKGLKSGGTYGKAMAAALFADLLGLDARITPGMATGDTRMAIMRGEIDFYPDSPGAALEGIESGDTRPLCVDLNTPMPVLPQVPSVMKFVASPSPQQREWNKIFEFSDLGKYVSTGPNVAKERVEYLRTVFEKIHKDPQFLKDRKKFERWPGGEPWLTGAEAQKMLAGHRERVMKEYGQMADYLSKKYFTVK